MWPWSWRVLNLLNYQWRNRRQNIRSALLWLQRDPVCWSRSRLYSWNCGLCASPDLRGSLIPRYIEFLLENQSWQAFPRGSINPVRANLRCAYARNWTRTLFRKENQQLLKQIINVESSLYTRNLVRRGFRPRNHGHHWWRTKSRANYHFRFWAGEMDDHATQMAVKKMSAGSLVPQSVAVQITFGNGSTGIGSPGLRGTKKPRSPLHRNKGISSR